MTRSVTIGNLWTFCLLAMIDERRDLTALNADTLRGLFPKVDGEATEAHKQSLPRQSDHSWQPGQINIGHSQTRSIRAFTLGREIPICRHAAISSCILRNICGHYLAARRD